MTNDSIKYLNEYYVRELFHLLLKANSIHLAQTKAVYFDTDTIILEEYIQGKTLTQYLLSNPISTTTAMGFLMGNSTVNT